ncbi:MAG: aminopeptidase P family protein [Deltaproteobacteria bacterium]|nr:aminopeptidase P family protein [Deltaproteobacteria bacterium]
MLLSEAELERLHKRFPYPRFSRAEYERRYQNIRRMMSERNLDCLLIIGGSGAYGRLWFNFRYVTNMMGKAEMANYCFFPKEGDPAVVTRPGHSLAGAMLARTAVRNVIVGKPSVLAAIVHEIKERGYEWGRVGIVEYDPYTSIPKNHWEYFTANLPEAELVFVTEEFIAMRLLKSAEEIDALEKSAELGDVGIRALQERVRPGMTEGEVFGIVHEAVLKAGGEMGMIQLGSCSMLDPDINDQRPRPVERVIGARDIINNELGIFYNGYEAQTGKPVVTGEPTAEYLEMFEIAMEGHPRYRLRTLRRFSPGHARRQSATRTADRLRPGAERGGPLSLRAGWQIGLPGRPCLHAADAYCGQAAYSGTFPRRLLRYRSKRPALLEQVPAPVGARTRVG